MDFLQLKYIIILLQNYFSEIHSEVLENVTEIITSLIRQPLYDTYLRHRQNVTGMNKVNIYLHYGKSLIYYFLLIAIQFS